MVGLFWGPVPLGNWLLDHGHPDRTDSFAAFALQVILAAILYTWLFSNVRGKLLPVMLAHALSNSLGALMVIRYQSYLQYQNWALLIMVIAAVLIFGTRDLIRRRRGEEIRQERVPAIGM